jgi:hypothetical protein
MSQNAQNERSSQVKAERESSKKVSGKVNDNGPQYYL